MTTWRGVLREVDRAARRAARQHAYEEKQRARAEAIETSTNAVEQYQILLSSITSLHKDCCDPIDWDLILHSKPPEKISKEDHFEMLAREKKQEYQPSLLIKIFQKTEKELSKLDEEILQGIEKDNQVFENQNKDYEEKFKKWESEKELASKIIGNDYEAIEEVLKLRLSIKNNPFIGERIDFHFF